MTKVGIYAILRVNGTVFDDAISREKYILLPIGLITSVYGDWLRWCGTLTSFFIGFGDFVFCRHDFNRHFLFNTLAWAAAQTVLFGTVPLLRQLSHFKWLDYSQRGEFKDHFKIAPQMKQHKVVALTYFTIALMMAGLPPFSGFLGKVFILQATAHSPYQLLIIVTVLVVSLLSIIAFTRVGFVILARNQTRRQP